MLLLDLVLNHVIEDFVVDFLLVDGLSRAVVGHIAIARKLRVGLGHLG